MSNEKARRFSVERKGNGDSRNNSNDARDAKPYRRDGQGESKPNNRGERSSFNPNFDRSGKKIGNSSDSDRNNRDDRRDDRRSSDRPAGGDRDNRRDDRSSGARPSYGNRDDKRDDRRERPSGGDRGDRRPSGDRDSRSSESRPSYGNRDDKRDDRSSGSRPSYGNRDDKRDDRSNGSRPSYGNRDDKRDDRSNGSRPSYGNRDDKRDDRSNGSRPSYGNRDDKRDDRRERPSGDRDNRRDDRSNSARPSFARRDDNKDDRRERPSGGDREDRRPSGDRDNRRDDRSGGARPSYANRDDKRDDRRERPSGGDRDNRHDDRSGGARRDDSRGDRRDDRGNSRFEPREYRERSSTGEYFDRDKHPEKKQEADSNKRKRIVKSYTDEVRLNKFIANSGLCSRREADDYITAGVISINGKTVTELGTKVLPDDEVRFNGERLKGEKKVYVLLNKPKNYVTTVEDPHADRTVMDLVQSACKERIYPVGRLDRNSLGVLLFTNDGELTKQLTHPSHNKLKVYHITLDKNVTQNDLKSLIDGFELEDGFIKADAANYVEEKKNEIGIEIHSGRNRIIRRMFEKLGYQIIKLDRVYFAGLTKKNLKRGEFRVLSAKEIEMLKMGAYE